MQHIIISSKNPVKIQAVKDGFQKLFPDQKYSFEGISVPSGVSDQPMGNEETYQGAYNRAKNAQAQHPTADYWLGIEGGNILHGANEMEAMAWVVALSKDKMGKARTAGFFLPHKVVELIQQGYELGHADDIVFGKQNSKHDQGACGLLTKGLIDRLALYVPAVIMALIPFKQKELY